MTFESIRTIRRDLETAKSAQIEALKKPDLAAIDRQIRARKKSIRASINRVIRRLGYRLNFDTLSLSHADEGRDHTSIVIPRRGDNALDQLFTKRRDLERAHAAAKKRIAKTAASLSTALATYDRKPLPADLAKRIRAFVDAA